MPAMSKSPNTTAKLPPVHSAPSSRKPWTSWESRIASEVTPHQALFRKAALKQGMKFAVSEHLGFSYNWMAAAHTSDKTGPLAGVPYDGADPQYADLYHALPKDYDNSKLTPLGMSLVSPDSWKQLYYRRIKDLIDQYE